MQFDSHEDKDIFKALRLLALMELKLSEVISLVIRYGFLLILGLNFALIYKVMNPLTIYPSFYAFNHLYGAVFYPPNVIAFKGYFTAIVNACVAGSAYYFLLILNLTTPMALFKRVKTIVFLLTSFYLINLLRIILFGTLFYKGFKYFDITHLWTWYLGSTILIVLLWFLAVWLFEIREIPVYSDFKKIILGTASRS